ncbi:hypothetical protein ZIOFF_014240 [Zingiber officinale]|uniref:Transcription initiation factor IIE subunit alpha N-terminal domain-containing protein n=1 Tax=Zingiber officinale TaxID=94328 RepID=A0A8J5HPU2_ZINOF|nr:hypothetical protein ZIOFF_014240 [Zingiber officinale]
MDHHVGLFEHEPYRLMSLNIIIYIPLLCHGMNSPPTWKATNKMSNQAFSHCLFNGVDIIYFKGDAYSYIKDDLIKLVSSPDIAKNGEDSGKEEYIVYNIYDVVRYRMHRMKKKIKDELDSRNTIQEYICPNCGRRYSAFDALQLVSLTDEYFHCENCNGELVAESDKLAAEEMGDGDDNARKRRREKLKDMLQKMEEQLKPLAVQIARVKDLPVPEFGSLQAWEARANAAARANGDANALDPTKSSQGQGYSGTPMPFLGETKVEVALSGVEVKGEDDESDKKTSLMKVIPPWMIKEGMSLTKEQRGDTVNVDKSSELGDDKKSKDTKEDEKSIQASIEIAIIWSLQKEQEEALRMQQEIDRARMPDYDGVSETERQVGKKAKRGVYEEDNVEWEDAPPAGSDEKYILADLNMEATASGDEDDDIDWEEG